MEFCVPRSRIAARSLPSRWGAARLLGLGGVGVGISDGVAVPADHPDGQMTGVEIDADHSDGDQFIGLQSRLPTATERCLARFGVRRTSMTDVATEVGVARPFLYRQVSSLQEAIALVTSRQLHLFLDELTAVVGHEAGPDTFIDAAVRTVTFARNHPIVLRIINDQPALIGELVTSRQLSSYAEQIVELLLLPPGADLQRLVRFALEPVLKPEPARRMAKTSR